MAKKLKGKGWYTLVAPKMFEHKVLGKTPAGDPETMSNRKVDISIINLMSNPSKYYLKFKFRVVKLDGDKAITEFDGMQCLRDYISRMVRHGVTRLDTVQDLTTKDGIKVRVKTITLISKKSRKEIEVQMRKYIKESTKVAVDGLKLDEFLGKILDDSLKRQIVNEGSKIYPIRAFEIRRIERLD
jgi:small subunit ribosomal protein S3Ae